MWEGEIGAEWDERRLAGHESWGLLSFSRSLRKLQRNLQEGLGHNRFQGYLVFVPFPQSTAFHKTKNELLFSGMEK